VWSEVLLSLCAAIGIIYSFIVYDKKGSDFKYLSSAALFSLLINRIAALVSFPYDTIVSEVTSLFIFISILSLLLLTVRKLKPEYARYPYILAYIPFLLILSYPLIAEMGVLIGLLLQLLQIAALLSFLFLIIGHFSTKEWLLPATVTLVMLLSAFTMKWYLGDITGIGDWFWQTMSAAGIILFLYIHTNYFKGINLQQ
jgi:hypothetical protein